MNYDFEHKTILVVEDDFVSTQLLKETFEGSKANVIFTESAEDAIEMCIKNSNLDLVLMDIKLPKINGYEATMKIKSIRRELPVIAQTAYVLKDTEQTAREHGCDDFIPKPIRPDELLDKVLRFLS
jgi:two-component system, cell cycle response regulator DivK